MKVQKPPVPRNVSSIGFCCFPTGHANKRDEFSSDGLQSKTAKMPREAQWEQAH